jgi:hypothetical protein
MTTILRSTFTRPNTSIPWFYQTTEFAQLFELDLPLLTNAQLASRVATAESVLGPDGLSMHWTITTNNINALNDFLNYQTQIDIKTAAYNNQNNIRLTSVTVESDDWTEPLSFSSAYYFENDNYKNQFAAQLQTQNIDNSLTITVNADSVSVAKVYDNPNLVAQDTMIYKFDYENLAEYHLVNIINTIEPV